MNRSILSFYLVRLTCLTVLSIVLSFSVTAQTNLVRYVCPETTGSSYFFYDELLAPGAANLSCVGITSGTQLRITEIDNPNDIATVSVTRLDAGPHRAQVKVNWKDSKQGVIRFKVQYRLQINVLGCLVTKWKTLYQYEIHKERVVTNVMATILEPQLTAEAATIETQSMFSAVLRPNDPVLSNLHPQVVATRIRFHNGKDPGFTEESNVFMFSTYRHVLLNLYGTGLGNFTFPTEYFIEYRGSTSPCGEWVPGPIIYASTSSSCYLDNVDDVNITPIGNDAIFHPEDKSYSVESNQSYLLQVEDFPDFNDNFHWVHDGGSDVTLTGNVFTIHKDIGSFKFSAIPNVSLCPTPEALEIVVGGENTTIGDDEACTIILPKRLQDAPFNLKPEDLYFQHFTTTAVSGRSIILMPGMNMELGAELVIEDEPNMADTDLTLNYTESTSFDEYGRVLSQKRDYFSDAGLPMQTQFKNLSSEKVLAMATLYDALGRQAVSTLPAPIVTSQPSVCPEDKQTGAQQTFTFKPDFVAASAAEPYSGGTYNFSHFDLANELTPVPLDASTEGTLGWYYSANNNLEPDVAISQYPYSRKLFLKDGSGQIKGITKPGDLFKAGSAYLATSDVEPVSPDDVNFNTNFNSYLSIRETELGFARPVSISGQFSKVVSIDEESKKSVLYSDKSGNIIISQYFGTGSSPLTTSYTFYDDADRQIVSISPNGLSQYDGSNFDEIDKTRFYYDHRGWLSATEEKIAGQATDGISRTEFIYRKDGTLRFSQNEVQRNAIPERYSYTNYDKIGRPIESGEYEVGSTGIDFVSIGASILESTETDGGLPENSGVKRERIITHFDLADPELPVNRKQRFVNGSVSWSKNENVTSWFSYDERGRVEWMVQDISGLGIKTLDYRYGPSGQAQEVVYQKGNTDEQFTHFYEYDADGRLRNVYTTRETLEYNKFGKLTNSGISYKDSGESGEIEEPGVLEHQATYHYYLHGPLKRVELATRNDVDGKLTLQGIDYVYTIDGSLKSINHADKDKDPGKDGINSTDVKPDVFGQTIEYHTNDYASAKEGNENVTIPSAYEDQYSGLIKALRWHSPTEPDQQFFYGFEYDQRNQFVKGDWGTKIGDLLQPNTLKPYHESIGGYDLNGNIMSLQRNGNILKPVNNFHDDLTYYYKPLSNILETITKGDGEDMETFRAYTYNDLGQMIQENAGEKTRHITYDVSGRVTGVFKNLEHTEPITKFRYDERGFRLEKTSFDDDFNPAWRTWYVRDASGTVLCTYEQNILEAADPIATEMPIYGSGRIGLYKPNFGITYYELTDHLGNVRAVIGEEMTKEYLATMETERSEEEEAEDEFVIKRSINPTFNHTPASFNVDGKTYEYTHDQMNEVNRINNRPNNQWLPDPIGTGIMLRVHPGDVINAEVFVKCANFSSDANPFNGVAGFLTSTFYETAIVDGVSIFNISDNNAFNAFLLKEDASEDEPKVFLNYILFDRNFKLQQDGFDFDQATDDAVLSPGNYLIDHERLELDLTIEKEGIIYIYVSNESEKNMDVYFDDLKIKHQYSNIVAGGDFYPFGLSIKDREVTRDKYRFGYQGQFSEHDEETGWNHFELREYDPVIARWNTVDPKRIGFSLYVGMGNNPIVAVDPDGGAPFSDFVNAKTGEVKHIDDNIDVVVVVEDHDWNDFVKFFDMTARYISTPSSRFGMLSKFGTSYMVGDMLAFYNKYENPEKWEYGTKLHYEGGRVFISNNPDHHFTDKDPYGVTIWGSPDPTEAGSYHVHYNALRAVEGLSSDKDLRQRGNGIYNVVVSPHNVYFFNRYKTETNRVGQSRLVPSGVNFTIPRSSFSK